jgi:RNA-directed DNA polymerase
VDIDPKFLGNEKSLFKRQNCLMFQTLKRDFLSKFGYRFYHVSVSFSNVAHYKNLFSKENISLLKKYVKSEQKLLAEWAVSTVCSKKIRRKQNVLFRSKSFRIYSVYNVSKCHGCYSTGVGGETFFLDKPYMFNIVERLRNLKNYKCNLDKGGLIPKKSGGQRALGISTIFERCVQQLLVLVLEPVIEPFSDSNSYGFRPFRSAHNALGQLKQSLELRKYPFFKWVFFVSIVSFFDEVSYNWLINNIPLNGISLQVLKSILNVGYFFGYKLIKQLTWAPQKSIISFLLINFVLNGLQDAVVRITKSVNNNYTISYANGNETSENLKPNFCRYADSIVVICRSKNNAQWVKTRVILFLQERGLKLSETKSYIRPIMQCKLKYLGYVFQYRINAFIKSKKINLYPSPKSLLGVKNKLRILFINSQNLTAYELVSKLNPVIKKWCSYFSLSQSCTALKKLEQFLYKRC